MAFEKPVTRRSACALLGVGDASLCLGGFASATGCAKDDDVIRIGTLATEDMLPMWVAEQQDAFAARGLSVEIVVFQSATELIAGISSGAVELAMTDPMVTAAIHISGVDVKIEWITLGTTAAQGRFGIMVGPQSNITSLSQLAGVGIGVGSNTILEYIMDKLLISAGVDESRIVSVELQKLPVRYQAMMAGEVEAAALPGSLLALGLANGCRLIADDTQGENLSQSVMISRVDFSGTKEGEDKIALLKSVWNEAAAQINASSDRYRPLLVQKANLNESIADTYPVSEYPRCILPTNAMIDPVLSWMKKKKYIKSDVFISYDETTGRFALR
ncbi:MAG: ABC transporter substrate-binding protein [Eggerthellaceae bacterium]|nr:ABC transporter substrate-binding protein [Eggerthellaceae bacterium]